jgi:5-methylthioadenosine/S-adenosylhomocysteine deaminase
MTMQRRILLVVGVLTLTLMTAGRAGLAAAASSSQPIILEGTIVTMNAQRDVIHDGRILIRDGRIVAVWQGGKAPDDVDIAGARRIELGRHAYIYPGLINLHDHPFFDVLPLWQPPSSHVQPAAGRPLGTEAYANRYQWNAGPPPPEYLRLVANASGMLTSTTGLGRLAEVIKFGKARMILGGTTTTQGGGSNAAYDSLLARNVEAKHFDRQRILSRVPAIGAMNTSDTTNLKNAMAAGLVDAWLVHLAEGVRDGDRSAGDPVSSRAEFSTLKTKGLLNDATVIVHGAGLEPQDFDDMAHAPAARADGSGDGRGAKLVWSPLSNLLLYGRTAAIYDAIAAGVVVSLGTDWSPSGSPNLLTELKIADRALRDPGVLATRRHLVDGLINGNSSGHGDADRALDQLLVEMVTINPAMAVRWDDQVGSIEPGKAADVLVITSPDRGHGGAGVPRSPYRRLIDATEADVALVMVGGEPQAGDVEVMALLKPGDFEVITSAAGCFEKAIDVTAPALPKGNQTLAQISALLGDGLRALGGDHPPAGGGPSSPFANTWSYLKSRVPGASALPDIAFNFGLIQFFGSTPDGKVNLESIALPPLFTADDHWWFNTLEAAADPLPPYATYPANANQLGAAGNPFAAEMFRGRWYAPACPAQ